jgi:hypothetical protein
MNVEIVEAKMEHSPEDGYLGHVQFTVEGHKKPYELTLQSKRGKEWSYSLNFSGESGGEEEIFLVEEKLEEDDDFFDLLLEAAKSKIAPSGG